MNPSNQYSESFCSHPRLKHERTLPLPICYFIAFHQLARCDAEESSSKQAKAWTVTACTLVWLVSCEMCSFWKFLFAFLFRSQRGRASEAWNHDKMERLTFLSFLSFLVLKDLPQIVYRGPLIGVFVLFCHSYCGAECEAAGVSSSSPNRSCDTTHTVQVEQIQHAVFCCTAACCLFSPVGEEQTKGEAEQTEQTHEGQGCSRFNP